MSLRATIHLIVVAKGTLQMVNNVENHGGDSEGFIKYTDTLTSTVSICRQVLLTAFCCCQIAALSFVCSPANVVFLPQFELIVKTLLEIKNASFHACTALSIV